QVETRVGVQIRRGDRCRSVTHLDGRERRVEQRFGAGRRKAGSEDDEEERDRRSRRERFRKLRLSHRAYASGLEPSTQESRRMSAARQPKQNVSSFPSSFY